MDQQNQETKNKNCLSKVNEFFFPESPKLKIDKPICLLHPIAIFVYRLIVFLYMFTYYFLLVIGNQQTSVFNQFKYYTRNGYYFTFLYFTLSIQYFILQRCLKIKKWKYAIQFLYELSFSFEFGITILNWTFLGGGTEGFSLYINLSQHAFPLAFLLIDYIFNPFRFMMSHLILVEVIFIILLFGVNLPYSVEVESIYSILTWQGGVTAGLVLGSIALTAIGFLLGALGFYCLKTKKIKLQQQQLDAPQTNQQIIQKH